MLTKKARVGKVRRVREHWNIGGVGGGGKAQTVMISA